MTLNDLFLHKNINAGVRRFRNTPGSVLLDVRTHDEYRDYHIAGSLNLPLQEIHLAENRLADKETVIYVHCLSGRRSAQAAAALKQLGYRNVVDIGGLSGYNGETVNGSRT